MLMDHLKTVAQLYCDTQGVSPSGLSVQVFGTGDRNRFGRVFADQDMKVSTYEHAMAWLSANWPAGTDWPDNVPRPRIEVPA